LKARLLDLDHLDKRSRAFNTATNIKAAVISDLGGPENISTLEGLLAGLAAALCEHAYTQWLSGEAVQLSDIALVQNAFLRLCSALGVERRAKDISKSIDSYLQDSKATSDD
jgi:hypothetical protein